MRAHIIAAALTLPFVLSACSGGRLPSQIQDESTTGMHPIKVERDERSTTLPVARNGHVAAERSRLTAMAIDIVRRGHGTVEVNGPSEAASEVASALILDGVPARTVLVKSAPGQSVTVTFSVYRAVGPKCGEFASDAAALGAGNFRNTPSSEWGCSTQRNFSEMISDPLDLVRMRGTETGANSSYPAGRVGDGVQKYSTPAPPGTVK